MPHLRAPLQAVGPRQATHDPEIAGIRTSTRTGLLMAYGQEVPIEDQPKWLEYNQHHQLR